MNVTLVEDKSVENAIAKTAAKLNKQYSMKKTDAKRKTLKRSLPNKIFTICFDVVSVILVIVCGLMCFSIINSRMQNTLPSFAGYSVMRVSSGSMRASGFEVGDNIAVRKVNPKTLKAGHKIAFYVYSDSYLKFNINTCSQVHDNQISKLQYSNSIKTVVGLQEKPIINAAKAGSKLVFHEITLVVEDEMGNRWFQTKGSSNSSVDDWFIAEDMVVGIYQDGGFANFLAVVVGKIASSTALLLFLILIPVLLIAFSIIKEYMRDFHIACIENEIVRGKRKLTDPYCVENHIGSNLSEKEKYKVLAQAKESEKIAYINLLWLGKKPESIRKHYIRRRLQLREYEEKLKLHKICERKLKQGVSMTKIATYYLDEKEKIEKRQEEINNRLKVIAKQHKKEVKKESKINLQKA